MEFLGFRDLFGMACLRTYAKAAAFGNFNDSQYKGFTIRQRKGNSRVLAVDFEDGCVAIRRNDGLYFIFDADEVVSLGVRRKDALGNSAVVDLVICDANNPQSSLTCKVRKPEDASSVHRCRSDRPFPGLAGQKDGATAADAPAPQALHPSAPDRL
jgi:hypothetical protein